jgi:IS605 OrfB family transposase
MNIATRKIEIYISETDKELKKQYYNQLREWAQNGRNYANDTITLLHSMYCLDKLAEEVKTKDYQPLNEYLGIAKGSLPYRLLSEKYKDLLPSCFRTAIGQQVFKHFGKTIKNVLSGAASISSFNAGYPLFFAVKDTIIDLSLDTKGGSFKFKQIPFRFKFGRDRSNNRNIVEKILTGEYIFSDSSIKFDGNKVFMLLTFKSPKTVTDLDKNKVLGVDLGLANPVYLAINTENSFRMAIGSTDGFISTRLSIQKQRRGVQRALKFAKGGRGRKHKLTKLEDLTEKEKNFATRMNHEYSKAIIEAAIKNNCGTINIEDLSGFGKDDKNSFVLRNWSYYQLQEFIKYKAKAAGIDVVVVNSKYTSQRCSKCGHIHKDNRQSQAKFLCLSCGYEDNADFNGAKNISIAHTPEFIKQITKHIKNLNKKSEEVLELVEN